MRGTHDGQTGPVPATGKSYEIHGVSVGTLQGGKIESNRDYWSLAEFLVQVGILPPLMPGDS
jgi:ketosteroid isomerase-like protein